jgi:hypothetical protein
MTMSDMKMASPSYRTVQSAPPRLIVIYIAKTNSLAFIDRSEISLRVSGI